LSADAFAVAGRAFTEQLSARPVNIVLQRPASRFNMVCTFGRELS